jgi:hypothetical protein
MEGKCDEEERLVGTPKRKAGLEVAARIEKETRTPNGDFRGADLVCREFVNDVKSR